MFYKRQKEKMKGKLIDSFIKLIMLEFFKYYDWENLCLPQVTGNFPTCPGQMRVAREASSQYALDMNGLVGRNPSFLVRIFFL